MSIKEKNKKVNNNKIFGYCSYLEQDGDNGFYFRGCYKNLENAKRYTYLQFKKFWHTMATLNKLDKKFSFTVYNSDGVAVWKVEKAKTNLDYCIFYNERQLRTEAKK